MNVFTIAGIVGILVIIVGVVIGALFVWLSQTVQQNQEERRERQATVNPAESFGYEIPADADIAGQLTEARKLAARRAAALPRGANMRIGRLGVSNLRTASQELETDPQSAVRIAAFHTWEGARLGPPVAGAAPQQQAAVAQKPAAPTKKPEDLVPGVDYEFIEITDDMAPAEVRKARIANAKARSAAAKALKQQAAAAPAAPAADQPAGEPVVAEAQKASPTSAAAAGIPEPEYIEITDDMAPAEVRKARIANAKARSQYHKALKEAGVDPKAATAVREDASAAPAATAASPKATTPASPTPAAAREGITVPDDIPQPDYIDITDDMEAGEVRKARVHNAKARSQYYKALKERGIDPKELEEQQAGAAAAAAEATEEAQETVEAAEPVPDAESESVAIPDNVAPPDYIEITDDMPADEVRRARVHNARERSRFFKDLKAAGVDPKSVDI